MTKQQSELLNFIRIYIEANGFSPSFREMQYALDLPSISSVSRLIVALEEQNQIVRLRRRARTIELARDPGLNGVALANASIDDLAREAERRGMILGYRSVDGVGRPTVKPVRA